MRPPGGRVANVSGQRQQETHHADAGHALQEHEVGVPRLRVAGNAQQSRGHAALVRIVRLVALLVPVAPLHPQATTANLNSRPAHKLSHKWAACVCQVAKGACSVGRTLTARESLRQLGTRLGGGGHLRLADGDRGKSRLLLAHLALRNTPD